MKSVEPPVIQDWLVRGFLWYSRGLMRKRFHTLAVDKLEFKPEELQHRPLIVAANHPGWWDPLVAAILCQELLPTRKMYAPIDAKALNKYRVLSHLGFYGLDLQSRKGTETFLATSRNILEGKNTSLWLTPEGRFCDVRDRTQALMPGISHLASRTVGVAVIPLAIEYAFWEEQHPEVLCRLGAPLVAPEPGWTKSQWHESISLALRSTQDELADQAIRRDTKRFEVILSAHQKPRTWYDFFRKWLAHMSRRKIELHHGDKFNTIRNPPP